MAELLVFARDNTNPDSEKDRCGCYKRGMPVVVFDDGHVWGREESLLTWVNEMRNPRDWPLHFFLFKFPGISAARIRYLIEPQYTTDSGILLAGPSGERQVYRRRTWRTQIDLLPITQRASIVARREALFANRLDRQAFLFATRRIADGVMLLRTA